MAPPPPRAPAAAGVKLEAGAAAGAAGGAAEGEGMDEENDEKWEIPPEYEAKPLPDIAPDSRIAAVATLRRKPAYVQHMKVRRRPGLVLGAGVVALTAPSRSCRPSAPRSRRTPRAPLRLGAACWTATRCTSSSFAPTSC